MPRTLDDIANTPIAAIPRRDPVRVRSETALGDVIARLRDQRRGAVIIEDDAGLIGIVTERDVMLRIDHADPEWPRQSVGEICPPKPQAIRDDQKIDDALNLMLAGEARHLPIVDAEGQVVGLLSIRDVLEYVASLFPAEFLNLPPDPDREANEPWGG